MQRKLADRIVTIAICAMLAASATATPAAAQTPRWLSGLFGGRASTGQDELAPPQQRTTTASSPKVDANVPVQASDAQSARSPAAVRMPRWLAGLFGGRADTQRNDLTAPTLQPPPPVLEAKADEAAAGETALPSPQSTPSTS